VRPTLPVLYVHTTYRYYIVGYSIIHTVEACLLLVKLSVVLNLFPRPDVDCVCLCRPGETRETWFLLAVVVHIRYGTTVHYFAIICHEQQIDWRHIS
jgi:hypothetical protein